MKKYLNLIQEPRRFFKSVAKEDISTTLKKIIPLIIVLYLINSVLNYIVYKEVYSKFPFPFFGNNFLLFYVLAGIVFLPLAIIISASLLHLSLKILKIKSTLAQNTKIFIYPMVPIYLISIIHQSISLIIKNLVFQTLFSFIVIIGSLVWSIILIAKGISEIYKISMGRAVGAYFLIFGLILGAMLALIIVILIIVLIAALLFKGFK